MQRAIMLIVWGAAFVGAASLAQDESEEPQEVDIREGAVPGEETCFTVSTIRNFDGLHDEYVYIEGGNEQFLLTMNQRCLGLRNAENIAIANPSNRVCSNSLAELTYRGVGGRVESCWISRVEAVEDRATALEIVRRRTARTAQ